MNKKIQVVNTTQEHGGRIREYTSPYGMVSVSETHDRSVYIFTFSNKGNTMARTHLPFEQVCDDAEKTMKLIEVGRV